MASYLDTMIGYGGRSYNTLVVSEGDMPAEAFIPSSTEDVKFEFQFGPEGNQNVIIPKGKILAAAAPEYDPLTETYRPAVKICVEGETPIGVAPYNVYETRYMVESENTVSPITRNYIQVPYFFDSKKGSNSQAVAASIGFGAAWYKGDENAKPEDIVGKFVGADDDGNFQVLDGNKLDMSKVVGQVLAVETNIPPAGFLQYCLELGNADYTAFIQKTREVLGIANGPNNRQANQAFADMAKFAIGMGSYAQKGQFAKDYLVQLRGGIRFLTDSYFKTRKRKTFDSGSDFGKATIVAGENSGLTVKEVTVDGKTTYTITYKTKDDEGNDLVLANTPVIAIKFDKRNEMLSQAINILPNAKGLIPTLRDLPELQDDAPAFPVVTVNGAEIPEKYIKIDYANNMIYSYLVEGFEYEVTKEVDGKDGEKTTVTEKHTFKLQDGPVTVSVEADIITREQVGLPAYMDFKGCVGMAKILLNK